MKPDFRLYLITDRKLFSSPEEMLTAIGTALEGGAAAVQLREKDLGVRELLSLAYKMRGLTKRFGAKLLINDRVDIALAVGADGVHLGGSSMPAGAARKASGSRLMIGVSAHSVQEARKAQEDGADFLTLGPIYETASKLQYGKPIGTGVLKDAVRDVSIPVYAIGGIRQDRVAEVLGHGAYGIALISAVLRAADVRTTTEEFVRKLS